MDFLLFHLRFTVAVALFTLLYAAFLCRETFYRLNRFFLLLCISFCFAFSFISFSDLHLFKINENIVTGIRDFKGTMMSTSNEQSIKHVPVQSGSRLLSAFNWPASLEVVYLPGLCIFISRFIFQCISLYRITKKSCKTEISGKEVYHLPGSVSDPFSFFKKIYADTINYSEKDLSKIIAHETVHGRQLHTLDILLMELLLVIFWYNPFCWLLKKHVVQNLEFLADKTVAGTFDKKECQYTLLRISVPTSKLSLTTNFNVNHLKKRISMLNRKKSVCYGAVDHRISEIEVVHSAKTLTILIY
jgi:hypothetical protein